MRDGNFDKLPISHFLKAVVSLPMRDGNKSRKERTLSILRLLAYL